MSKNIKVGDLVFYLKDNKLHSAPVFSINRVETDPENERLAITDCQKRTFIPFGNAGTYYATCHGVFTEVFLSRNELADFIIK